MSIKARKINTETISLTTSSTHPHLSYHIVVLSNDVKDQSKALLSTISRISLSLTLSYTNNIFALAAVFKRGEGMVSGSIPSLVLCSFGITNSSCSVAGRMLEPHWTSIGNSEASLKLKLL